MADAEQGQLAQRAGVAHTRRDQEMTQAGFTITARKGGETMQLTEQEIGLNLCCRQRFEQIVSLSAIARTMTPIHEESGERHLRRNQVLRCCQAQPMEALVELPSLVQY